MITDNKELAKQMLPVFLDFYDKMYNQEIEDCPQDWVEAGDTLLAVERPLTTEFAILREDYLTSDREVAAFAMAYNKVNS